jgi:hypothetical protein
VQVPHSSHPVPLGDRLAQDGSSRLAVNVLDSMMHRRGGAPDATQRVDAQRPMPVSSLVLKGASVADRLTARGCVTRRSTAERSRVPVAGGQRDGQRRQTADYELGDSRNGRRVASAAPNLVYRASTGLLRRGSNIGLIGIIPVMCADQI